MSNTDNTRDNRLEPQSSRTIDRRMLLGGAAALTAAGVISVSSGVFAQDTDHNHGEASPSASPQASPSASPAGEGVTVVAVDIAFEPKEFTIPADTDVVVTIENQGALQHDFQIEELEIASDLLNGGESTEVTINAPAGTYEYFCSVTGHREAGMVGTLTVE
jgi:uncharacterized cupredoxin-like copper-binding protein